MKKLAKAPLFYLSVFLVLILGFQVVNFVSAFTEPGSAFPGGAPASPLDTSGTAQTKSGNLNLGRLNITGSDVSLRNSGICLKDTSTGNVSCRAYWDQIGAGGWEVSGNDVYTTVSGNVGIGTTSPGAKLEVSGGQTYLHSNPTTVIPLHVRSDSATGTVAVFGDTGGNIGIGKTDPGVKLDVNGPIRLGLSSGDTNNDISSAGLKWFAGYLERAQIRAVNYEHGNGKKALTFNLHTSDEDPFSNTEVMRITPFGVGIGVATTTGAYKLRVEGPAYSTGGWESSDARLKKNVENIGNVLNRALNLTGVYYDWRSDEYPTRGLPEGRQIGLIAQEVEKVFPELVNTDGDGYKALAYDKLTAVLLEAIKEQQAQIEALNARLQALEN